MSKAVFIWFFSSMLQATKNVGECSKYTLKYSTVAIAEYV